uniref:ABC transporter substrate binding protein n=1 Tax=Ndongobacter massiliensis TaxID=1871025 RepID=UPI000931C789|nr:ABC transporter substrate binding protein [Ndongobacter massiliensis]
MKRMRKWIVAVCTLLFLLGPGGAVWAASQEPAAPAKHVSIVLPMDHLALNETRDGIIEVLREKYGDSITIDVKNANGDSSLLNSVMQEVVSQNPDLILPIATGPAQIAATTTKDIPIVFSAVTDPVSAKLCPSWDEAGANCTGVSDMVDFSKILDFAQELYPGLKTVGIVYTSAEVNSIVQVEEAKKIIEERGLTWKEKTITNTSELQQVAESLAPDVDIFYTPTDNNVASAMPTFRQVAERYKKPVFPGATTMVESGGTGTVGLRYADLGRQAGEMAVRILEGSPLSDNPPEKVEKSTKILNRTQAEALGLKVPEDLKNEIEFVESETSKEENNGALTTQLAGALQLGLLYGILGLGLYIPFRILNIPDMTTQGSFTLGMVVAGVLTAAGHPFLAMVAAFLAGGSAGVATGVLHTKFSIPSILAGILTMTGLYTVNLFIMGGKANLSLINMNTIFTPLTNLLGSESLARTLVSLGGAALCVLFFSIFFHTRTGLTLRATGDNDVLVRHSSINTDLMKTLGLAVGNALAGLSGAMICHYNAFADVNMGTGILVVGLAAIIIGETLLGRDGVTKGLLTTIFGSVLYRYIVAIALKFDILPSYGMNLISTAIVIVALMFPSIQRMRERRKKKIRHRALMMRMKENKEWETDPKKPGMRLLEADANTPDVRDGAEEKGAEHEDE